MRKDGIQERPAQTIRIDPRAASSASAAM
eukprot:SAG11_NODE_30620_length_299_cov_0.780000_1_plen_28_part_10